MAFVRGPATDSTAAGSRVGVSSSMSANTTLAPSMVAPDAVATKVIGVVTTSSPGPTPTAAYAVCSAVEPLVTVTAGAPTTASMSASNCATRGPVVSQSLCREATTASTSDSSID